MGNISTQKLLLAIENAMEVGGVYMKEGHLSVAFIYLFNKLYYSVVSLGSVWLSIREPTRAEARVPQRMPSLASLSISAASAPRWAG